ncbi:hypothetical protein SAMD00019534_035960 [Acytostelium subglobosum LB1]|uniref:hypothetical protein n=1 Tax=Acytostelium subglobosum LB1 TaxID=1410327 RepID=UPI0006450E1C|nr:hypothetical protein SAMD00019534_035960 [Acytostelium subglobosum LB1]GAM20421.1 hypothetical protein SAMD00019534_035960 [Acytostelium subglobosum LB1]|eukprot:XP_012759942.1 hypothetical protein SAMD00019534_035960 [Acytostelium subglobosum LB1]
MANFVRKMVSKKKRRFEWGNFDLDLTYITDRIIAMGFPSESIEGLYRNNMRDVQRFFQTLHPGHYKVYNLCSERKYPHDKFANNVSEYPFDDHNPPPLQMIIDFCYDVERWLDEHPENVAAIHCKAGKGRTGTMIACFLLYNKSCQTGSESIRMFGNKRTHNGKGITIPSQSRYVRYFEALLQYGRPIPPIPTVTKVLSLIRINPLPNFALAGGCDPFLAIGQRDKSVFYTKPIKIRKGSQIVEVDCGNILLSNDVKVQFFNKSSKGHMFSFCFHTAFIDGPKMHIRRLEIDKAHKDNTHKNFHPNFSIELQFSDIDSDEHDDGVSTSSSSSSSTTGASQSADGTSTAGASPFGQQTTYQTGLTKMYNNNRKSKFFGPDVTKDGANNGGHERKVSNQLFTCPKCQEQILPGEVSLNDGKNNYHWRCMKCNNCQKSLSNESDCLFQENGDIHCTDCANKSGTEFFKMCNGCDKVIKTSYYEEVGDMTFHSECFACSVCHTELPGKEFAIKGGRLQCTQCINKEKEFNQRLTLSDRMMKNLNIAPAPEPPAIVVLPPTPAPPVVAPRQPDPPVPVVMCQRCNKPVGLRPLVLDIGVWHKACFSCAECDRVIDTSIYYIKDDKPICCDCDRRSNKVAAEEFICFGCKNVIMDEEMMDAIGEKWHVHCLTCSVCRRHIDGPFGDHDGIIYCKEDYERLFGTTCDICSNTIIGTYLKVNGRNLHQQCFRCHSCNCVLEGGKYFPRGDHQICNRCRIDESQRRKLQQQLNTYQNNSSNTHQSPTTTSPRSNYDNNNNNNNNNYYTNNNNNYNNNYNNNHNDDNTYSPRIGHGPTSSSTTTTSPAPEPILFVKKPNPTRLSTRVKVNDMKENNKTNNNNNNVDTWSNAFHRQMERSSFKAARPSKDPRSTRKDFLGTKQTSN